MFFLLHMRDTIRVPAHSLRYLQANPLETLRSEINTKYANKVLPDQGLVIALHSIISRDAPQIFPGDGGVYVRTSFRLMVFCPSESEILVGQVKQSTKDGIIVSLGFFDHIIIPPENIPTPNYFDEEEGVWIWNFDDNKMYIDLGHLIRVRVSSVQFAPFNSTSANRISVENAYVDLPNGQRIVSAEQKAKDRGYLLQADPKEEPAVLQGEFIRQNPTVKLATDTKIIAPTFVNTPATAAAAEDENAIVPKSYIPPLEIKATINTSGLGLLEWW